MKAALRLSQGSWEMFQKQSSTVAPVKAKWRLVLFPSHSRESVLWSTHREHWQLDEAANKDLLCSCGGVTWFYWWRVCCCLHLKVVCFIPGSVESSTGVCLRVLGFFIAWGTLFNWQWHPNRYAFPFIYCVFDSIVHMMLLSCLCHPFPL